MPWMIATVAGAAMAAAAQAQSAHESRAKKPEAEKHAPNCVNCGAPEEFGRMACSYCGTRRLFSGLDYYGMR